MGFFTIEKRSQKQSIVSEIVDLIALNDSGVMSEVSGKSALLNSDIFTGVSILARDIASAEFKTDDNYIYNLLNRRNTKTTSFNAQSLWISLISNALLNNNSYAQIVRNNNLIEEIRFLNTSQVTVLESANGEKLGYKVMQKNGKTIELNDDEMIHLKALSIDGKVGISPLYSLKPEISMLKNGNSLLNSFFKKGISTSGILKLSNGSALDADSKKKIREAFEQANSGSQNSGSVMVLDSTQEFKPFEVSYEILKMIQSNTYSTKQIAKTLGIPLSRFGMELVNSKDSDANDIYITSTLHSWSVQIQQELFNKLGVEVILDFSYLKGADKDTLLTELVRKNGGSGLLTINEARKALGLDATKDGEQIYVNSASVPLNSLTTGGVEIGK